MYNPSFRKYMVKHNGKGYQIIGGFSFGAYDAAKKFTKDNFIGFEVIPGGQLVSPSIMKFEIINHKLQIGDVLWVVEV